MVPTKTTTVVLSADVLSSARSFATRTGRDLDAVIDAALREYVDARALGGLLDAGNMAPHDALDLAVQETHAYRSR
jgi:hypothetical protein